ncbi:MAG: (2Fe-2S) ferredoxin domain-containing protein [Dehalococcoides mccartyi]|uniref:(2Fe-2S) ferredoxin domain-containing protein n=2 Tax=Dehalococcoides mccartyi TaxID=61435 RepID=A0AB38Z8C0_9CHLR|nr:(2Fe-2S) ferredoxin domain-containing protein [Dehalococcoides mccartyi]AAW39642.1 ferredoxin, 2Fe-2S [Dehalococcoides mccartyi 195]AII59711.1 ferredoxin [Dehalococcoides mccartyi CG4]AQU03411.1 ferredoxin [Dehalococcoides mccartyi]AQU04709.1 ferredoxin [Dehalococcoides mccartyi]MBF4482234.1 (2Fe-2S) ferredoxin domain-containing protein [Dehalococcoides mccartyi]
MKTPDYHILVCNSFRVNGDPQGICNRKGAADLLGYLENEIIDRGLNVLVSSTGCLKSCEHGPAMVIYPPGWWYGEVDTAKLDIILDALEDGQAASELCLS